jgi:twitching motility protein PilI
MPDTSAVRDRQARLSERPQAVGTQAPATSWLAVESAGRGFLLPLREAGEIFAAVPLLPVAHTKPWFLGVANLRGGLHGVVDLGAFLGLSRAGAGRDGVRWVAFAAALDINGALQVDKLAGLRGAERMAALPAAAGAPAFAGPRWRDDRGRVWQELRLAALARDEAFLAIAA